MVDIFAHSAVGFILGLRVHVGVSRRLREPACGVAFTVAGLLSVDPAVSLVDVSLCAIGCYALLSRHL
ncbi:hypothetical protein Taro_000161 [Colocasia esculenta]|uniref:Uncharacterized protein n=1 Tax=Colocasia esculenta TaxID=4460 RepID=A0A843TE56_COLES|nr:hypothetical protein [Colocasia esculenta]